MKQVVALAVFLYGCVVPSNIATGREYAITWKVIDGTCGELEPTRAHLGGLISDCYDENRYCVDDVSEQQCAKGTRSWLCYHYEGADIVGVVHVKLAHCEGDYSFVAVPT